MKTHTANDIAPALESIGMNLSDLQSYRIEPGRILISIPDNDEAEADKVLATLRRNLPEWAKANWTGASDTDNLGDTTSDCEITWDY